MPSARALARHQPGELRLVAAERFRDDDGDVIGRLGDDGADRGLDPDGFAGLEAELGGRLRGGVRRHLQFGRRA